MAITYQRYILLNDSYVFLGDRGIRNKNPGNLKISSVNWLGKIPISQNTDKVFEQFTTMDYGVRALIKNLQTYFNSYNLNTIRKIINRFAPSSENDTNSYINTMSRLTGYSPDQILSPNRDTLIKLARAITGVENGLHNMLSVAAIERGYDMAGITGTIKQRLFSKEAAIFVGLTIGVAGIGYLLKSNNND